MTVKQIALGVFFGMLAYDVVNGAVKAVYIMATQGDAL